MPFFEAVQPSGEPRGHRLPACGGFSPPWTGNLPVPTGVGSLHFRGGVRARKRLSGWLGKVERAVQASVELLEDAPGHMAHRHLGLESRLEVPCPERVKQVVSNYAEEREDKDSRGLVLGQVSSFTRVVSPPGDRASRPRQ